MGSLALQNVGFGTVGSGRCPIVGHPRDQVSLGSPRGLPFATLGQSEPRRSESLRRSGP